MQIINKTEKKDPRITFGIIILNGEPFIRYNLRAIYPFAHEILIVEGAYWASSITATADGHSTDNTLEELYRFKREEDPRGIITIITKEGLWSGLTEQCQAWTEKVTGDYIWAIDIDEFYKPDDMQKVISLIKNDPEITMISFKLIQFCFNFDFTIHSGRDYFKHGIMECRRIFKFGPNFKYIQHEPPTVIDSNGTDLKKIKYINNEQTSALGIYIYHYTAIFQEQLEAKAKAYSLRGWKNKSEYAMSFFENWVNLKKPFHLGWEYKHFTWIEKFKDNQPPEIDKLKQDIISGKIPFKLRDNTDVKKLLSTRLYQFKKTLCKLYERPKVLYIEMISYLKSVIKIILKLKK